MHLHEEVLAVSVAEAARRLGVSPRTLATLVAQKSIRSRRVGRRRLIPVSALEEFLAHDAPKHVKMPPKPAKNARQ